MPSKIARYTTTGWVDVANLDAIGSGDEVWVGPDAPTGPEELWYDTDADPVAASIPAWNAVTVFQNGWGNYGAQWPGAAYRKIGDEVMLRGLIAGGANSTTAFILPVGYRTPAYGHHFAVASADAFGIVRVYSDGQVQAGNPIASQWADLAGIRFSVTP